MSASSGPESWTAPGHGYLSLHNLVVRFQHKYYVQIALFSGLILPCLIAKYGWNDGMGGLVWGGAVARLLIW